jgi:Tol biopolymer transport system component
MQPAANPIDVHKQLERILRSEAFRSSERSRNLLAFLVERAASGNGGTLKEYTIGTEALGRSDSFDPRTDPIVRAEASRLRQRLELYYGAEGRSDPVQVRLPKGSYVPEFESRASTAVPIPAATNNLWPWKAATAFLALALLISLWTHLRRQPNTEARRSIRFEIDLGHGRFVGSEVGTDVALLPDGRGLVFVALDSEGKTHLFKRRLEEADAVEMTGTEGARNPFVSPDGHWVGFWADARIKKTLLEGGSPITLCEATDLLGATWSQDGRIFAALDSSSRIYQIPQDGGARSILADLGSSGLSPKWPQALPGGRNLLFTSINGPSDGSAVGVLSLAGKSSKILIRGGTYGRYLPSGHLVYVNRGKLFAVPFNLDKLEIRGVPAPVLEDVSYSSIFGYAQFDFAADGTFIYRRSSGKGASQIVWLDSAGNTKPWPSKAEIFQYPRLSPNGKQLSASLADGEREDIWTFDVDSGASRRVSSGDRNYVSAMWSFSGRFLIMGGRPGGIYWRPASGSGDSRRLTNSLAIQNPWSLTPDGKRLAYFELSPKTGFDIWTVPIDESGGELHVGKPEPFLQSKAFEVYPAFSPDGHWLAYGSNESGTWQVYVRAFPDDGRAVQISINGGRIPAWSAQTHELLYRTDDQRILASPYRVEGKSFRADQPRIWPGPHLADTGVIANFDIAPESNRIAALMPASGDADAPNHASILLNFFDRLPR